MLIHQSADDVAQRGTDGNGTEEDRHDAAALAHRKIIRQQTRRDGDVGGLADAYRRARHEQREKVDGKSGQRGRETPAHYADRDQPRPRAAVSKRAKHGREQRIDYQEAGHQRS